MFARRWSPDCRRVESKSIYNQTFDAENRLVSVTVGGQTTQFLYDPDGNLVKKINPDNTKTLYVGRMYEVNKNSGGTVTGTITYYPAVGAMRINSTVYYVLKDHLGSASVVTDSTGTTVGEDRFYPFGETRFTTGSMQTDKLFTGQREITGLGIYHYGARFYSPKLGRFLSADTMVPGYANPQNLNRYSYVLNNPLGYIDPSGHNPCRSDYLCKRRAERMAATQAANATDKTAHSGMVAQSACFSCTYSGGGGVNPAPVPSSGGSTPDYCSTHPGSCGIPAPVVTPSVLPTTGTAVGTPPSSFTQAGSSGPDWGKYIAGDLLLIAGELTMLLGGITIGSAVAEFTAEQAAAPATFGLSEVLAVIHAPAVFALGVLIFSAGAGMAYGGGKLMWESNVFQWGYSKFTGLFK